MTGDRSRPDMTVPAPRAAAEPCTGPALRPDQVELLVELARSAPSIHNSQPWRLLPRPDGIEVHADPRRVLPAVDRTGRQRVISCGTAVFGARLAMAHLGFAPVTTLLPDPADPDHLATVACGARQAPERWQRTLYAVAPRRRTNRGPYRSAPVPVPVRAALRSAAAAEGALVVEVAAPADQAALAGLLVRGAAAQAATPEVGTEFRRWLREEDEPPAGTPVESWLRAPLPLPLLAVGERLGPADRAQLADLVRGSTLLVLCTERDDRAAWLTAGQALHRLLLTAAAAGVAVSFLHQAIEVPALRAELVDALRLPGPAQLLLRIGYAATPATRTGRRPAADVTG